VAGSTCQSFISNLPIKDLFLENQGWDLFCGSDNGCRGSW
jgi:hypothetical protein